MKIEIFLRLENKIDQKNEFELKEKLFIKVNYKNK